MQTMSLRSCAARMSKCNTRSTARATHGADCGTLWAAEDYAADQQSSRSMRFKRGSTAIDGPSVYNGSVTLNVIVASFSGALPTLRRNGNQRGSE